MADVSQATDLDSQGELAAQLISMARAYQTTQLLHTAAELGVADLLADGPRTVDDLAQSASVHAPSLYRLLIALESLGILRERDDGRFDLAPLGHFLREGSMRAHVLHSGGDMYKVWGELTRSIRTGEPSFSTVFGVPNWQRREQNPGINAIFTANQAAMTRLTADFVAATYPFPSQGLVIDVGGGTGTLLAAVLKHHPELHGILVDLPEVVERSPAVLAAAGVEARARVEGGDFFQSIPASADVYILSRVLHDWDDTKATQILQQCRRVMSGASKLVLVEVVASQGNAAASLIDLHMLVTQGGQERSEPEWRSLLAEGGFILSSVGATLATGHRILDAVPR